MRGGNESDKMSASVVCVFKFRNMFLSVRRIGLLHLQAICKISVHLAYEGVFGKFNDVSRQNRGTF
jgi:hypothetical protein